MINLQLTKEEATLLTSVLFGTEIDNEELLKQKMTEPGRMQLKDVTMQIVDIKHRIMKLVKDMEKDD